MTFSTANDAIESVLNQLRSNLGLGETPPGSNDNFIVEWYNATVEAIGTGPWCEMTNTWAMWTSGCHDLKKGRAYTVWAAEDGENHANNSSWNWGTAGMQAGDQVYYDWSGNKGDVNGIDHTGTVERINSDGTFYVLEGNISDTLKRVLRDGTYVVGYVRFDWAQVVSSSPSPSSAPIPLPAPPSVQPFLSVDGELGPKTITRWQQIMGTPADGVISRPSELTKAVQILLRDRVDANLVVDGYGIAQDNHPYQTIGALQRYLRSPVDQVWSLPISEGVKALQRRLNTGSF